MGTYDLVFKKTDTISENKENDFLTKARELAAQLQYDEAREQLLLAIEHFKKRLSVKAHDKVARQGLTDCWELMADLYFTDIDYVDQTERRNFNYGEKSDSVFAFSHLKTIFLDYTLEGEWKNQCNGKYGGPKPIKMSWKQFYFENEKKVDSLRSAKNRLKWAVENGHHAYLNFLLKKSKVKLNVDDYTDKKNLYSYLEIAIRKNFIQVVSILLDNNANVNILGKHKWTPLFWAIFTYNYDIVKLLLDQGAKVNTRDENGLTPLHLATRNGSLEITKLLLKYKAKVNVVEKVYSLSPIELAAYQDHFSVVEVLLDHKADMKRKDKYNRTLLHWAATNGKTKLVSMLLRQRMPVDALDNEKRTPLHWAAQSGQNDVISVLLDYKADVNKKDRFGDSPLVIAAYFGHIKEVSNLFEHGAR